MAYGLRIGAFLEQGSRQLAVEAQTTPSAGTCWRSLSDERRLRLIEQALHAANDGFDVLQLAL
jgi:hypothetical protein